MARIVLREAVESRPDLPFDGYCLRPMSVQIPDLAGVHAVLAFATAELNYQQ